MTEFEKNWVAPEQEHGWELGTCHRGRGVKVHGARVGYKFGEKGWNMILPFCATDTRVSKITERDVKPAGVREINCQTCMKIGASFRTPFTG
jgi:hypothetical protein